jgi:hypothetical protein
MGSAMGVAITRWLLTGLVLVGLLLVPVTCTLVDHPHSLFDSPSATGMEMPDSHRDHPAITHLTGHPPLAGAPLLPELHPGTVVAWLAASTAVEPTAPGAADLPTVTSTMIVMVGSSLSALQVALQFLLVAVLIATLPLASARKLHGWVTSVLAPPPRLLHAA